MEEEKPPKSVLAIPRRRRNRLRTSCQPCRTRKSKCDGNRPSCYTCLSRGRPDQCVYEQMRPGPYRTVPIRNIPYPSPNDKPSSPSPPTSTYSSSRIGHTSRPTLPISSKLWSSETKRKDNDVVIPNEETPLPNRTTRQEEAIFGPPSTHSFISRVVATIEPCNKKPTRVNISSLKKPFLNDPIGFTVSNTDDVRLDIDALLLPEKNLADSLISTYWRYSHPIFPVLHRPSFMKKYENLWKYTESFSSSKYTGNDMPLLAMVNVVLAIGGQRSEHCPADRRKRDAETLYRRSVRLISAETLDSYSFEVVQLFLLRVIYLQYTSFASRCWSTLGIAQRVAYGLGLHKDAPESTSQLEREMRRRVWHVSIIMDRLVMFDIMINELGFPDLQESSIASYTFGWPMAISGPNLVPIPQAIDDEYLSDEGEGRQPANKPSRLDFFHYYVKMCDVPREISDNIHVCGQNSIEQGSTTPLTQYISEMPKYCLQLDELLSNLPSHLQEANEHTAEECFQIQGQILRTRSIYVRLTILRPCLLATVANRSIRSELLRSKSDNFSLTISLLNEINKLCVSTARTVIDKVHKNIHIVYRASTWHTLRVTFGSATVLLAASLLPELQVDLDEEPNKTSWEQAIAIFEFYMSYDISAQGGIQALWDYRQKFEATKRRREPPQTELGRAELQPTSQGGTAVTSSAEITSGMDNVFFGADIQGPDGDLSQAFFDWNWLDFDITEFMIS